jgi:hypothetical protein
MQHRRDGLVAVTISDELKDDRFAWFQHWTLCVGTGGNSMTCRVVNARPRVEVGKVEVGRVEVGKDSTCQFCIAAGQKVHVSVYGVDDEDVIERRRSVNSSYVMYHGVPPLACWSIARESAATLTNLVKVLIIVIQMSEVMTSSAQLR